MEYISPTVKLTADDVRRLAEAVDEGFLYTSVTTSADTLKAYAECCYTVKRPQIIISPVPGRDDRRRLVVDTFPIDPTIAQCKGLEVALRQVADVHEIQPPDGNHVAWYVEVSDDVLTDLVPDIMEIFGLLSLPAWSAVVA